MRTIIEIIGIEEKESKKGDKYHITYATLDDGMEVRGYGEDYSVGDKVEVWYSPEYDTNNMKHPDRDKPSHYYTPNVRHSGDDLWPEKEPAHDK